MKQVTFLLSEKDVNLVVDSSKGKRVNRGLASNDHPGSFAGQWAGRSILPGDADKGRTATVSHLKEEVRIMGNDGLEKSQY